MNQSSNDLINNVLKTLTSSVTPFHAVKEFSQQLETHGFTQLQEGQTWQLKEGERYFVVREGGSLIAFSHYPNLAVKDGFSIAGAHTDSPCLKIKPQPIMKKHGYIQLPVDIYGGILLHSWMDRELGLAGSVTYHNHDNQIQNELIAITKPLLYIPNLAVHLSPDKTADTRTIDRRGAVHPILMMDDKSDDTPEEIFLKLIVKELEAKQGGKSKIREILDFDLSLFDLQPPSITGALGEFLTGGRLDNLLSCIISLRALLSQKANSPCMIVFNNHEEIGSKTYAGADGSFLQMVMRRLFSQEEDFYRMTANSKFLSIDNAHAVHPNYSDRHMAEYPCLFNQGPVIKYHSGQKYATTGEIAGFFKGLCKENKIPYQLYSTRNDIASGGTLGPIVASKLGIPTIDVGLPTLGMHAIREMAGIQDISYMYELLTNFFHTKN